MGRTRIMAIFIHVLVFCFWISKLTAFNTTEIILVEGNTAVLNCNSSQALLFEWYYSPTDNVKFNRKILKESAQKKWLNQTDDDRIEKNGSLVIHDITVGNEGWYYCHEANPIVKTHLVVNVPWVNYTVVKGDGSCVPEGESYTVEVEFPRLKPPIQTSLDCGGLQSTRNRTRKNYDLTFSQTFVLDGQGGTEDTKLMCRANQRQLNTISIKADKGVSGTPLIIQDGNTLECTNFTVRQRCTPAKEYYWYYESTHYKTTLENRIVLEADHNSTMVTCMVGNEHGNSTKSQPFMALFNGAAHTKQAANNTITIMVVSIIVVLLILIVLLVIAFKYHNRKSFSKQGSIKYIKNNNSTENATYKSLAVEDEIINEIGLTHKQPKRNNAKQENTVSQNPNHSSTSGDKNTKPINKNQPLSKINRDKDDLDDLDDDDQQVIYTEVVADNRVNSQSTPANKESYEPTLYSQFDFKKSEDLEKQIKGQGQDDELAEYSEVNANRQQGQGR